jgi:serine phosphatase RsbU (regulator of sigma subunit)/anti-sigma regulatory factor (Ser/Thr protein kinase)
MLLLAPPIVGAFLFGPVTGTLLGLFAGVVAFAHADLMPLDFYEHNVMTTPGTLVLLAFTGLLSGLLFKFALRRDPRGGSRYGIIIGCGILLSAAASGFMLLIMAVYFGGERLAEIQEYLMMTPGSMLAQMAVDAVAIVLLSLVVDAAFLSLATHSPSERKLLTIFSGWLLAISAIVFMLTSAFIFTGVTQQEDAEYGKSMMTEAKYLAAQLDGHPDSDPATVLHGFTEEDNGNVVVTDKLCVILGTDNEARFPVGDSFVDDIGYGEYFSHPEDPANNLLQIVVDSDDTSEVQTYTADKTWTMEFSYLAAAAYDGGYVAILRPSSMVFQSRFIILTATTLLAFLLIFATALVAAFLLKTDVARRIDETNESLGKITEGHLDEDVTVRDSSEFASLSAGINSTVAALKDTIEQVERKNAQELLTAKAIQESALPSAEPPFPGIDAFDLHATMDPAREVGGDFYDYFDLGARGIGFVIADVSGKGIPAALFMMAAKTAIHGAMEANEDLAEAIGIANRSLCEGNEAEMFVTVFAGVLDYRAGKLTYVNAGHNRPLLMRDGAWSWLTERSGPYMGSFDWVEYKQFETLLGPGDGLFAYTDGVNEAFNTDDKPYGNTRLEAFLTSHGELHPRQLLRAMRAELAGWSYGAEQSDDITMLALRYGIPPEWEASLTTTARLENFGEIEDFTRQHLKEAGCPSKAANKLLIAVEELVVNVCSYAYPDATDDEPGALRIHFTSRSNPDAVVIEVCDDGVPFNPLEQDEPGHPGSLEEANIGGLGLVMTRKLMDEVEYAREGMTNVTAITKRWE